MSTEDHAHVRLFGIDIDNITLDEFFQDVSARIKQGTPSYVVTPNVDHVCTLTHNAVFREAYGRAWRVLADGMPLLWAARLLGTPIRQKLSGSDLLPSLADYAAEAGHSIFLLGAAEGVGEEAAEKLQARHPELRVAGTYSPPLGFEKDPDANAEVIRRLREAAPDICFVALGSPKQEIWMHRHAVASGVSVLLGVGASLDFVAGRVKRAPRWMQRAGLEWLWRLCAEPRRLWRRYLVDDTRFFVLFWRAWWRRVLRRERPNGP